MTNADETRRHILKLVKIICRETDHKEVDIAADITSGTTAFSIGMSVALTNTDVEMTWIDHAGNASCLISSVDVSERAA